jgi:predicted RNase H-like HicB family nuclease
VANIKEVIELGLEEGNQEEPRLEFIGLQKVAV